MAYPALVRGAIVCYRYPAMATKCDLCGKGTTFGRNIRHQHTGRWERKAPRTNRLFKANVHVKKLTIGDVTRRVHVCTRCTRTLSKVR